MYLHCHTPGCGWSQDDFWSIGGWNPVNAVKRNDDEKQLFEEKVYVGKWFLEEANEWLPDTFPYWKDEKGFYTKGQYLQAYRFYQLYKRCMNMDVKTFEEWQKIRKTWKCPKCSQHNPDID